MPRAMCSSCSGADRGVPCRDREGEEALARLRNGEPELGHLVARRHPAQDRIGGDGAREHHHVQSVLLPRTRRFGLQQVLHVTEAPVHHAGEELDLLGCVQPGDIG